MEGVAALRRCRTVWYFNQESRTTIGIEQLQPPTMRRNQFRRNSQTKAGTTLSHATLECAIQIFPGPRRYTRSVVTHLDGHPPSITPSSK